MSYINALRIIHSWGFLVWPLHKGMEGFPSPFGSLKAILWDWSYFSVGLISLYAIPKNSAVIHFFGIAWSDFQSSRFVTLPIFYSLLIKKKGSLEGNWTPVLWTRPACFTNWAIQGQWKKIIETRSIKLKQLVIALSSKAFTHKLSRTYQFRKNYR